MKSPESGDSTVEAYPDCFGAGPLTTCLMTLDCTLVKGPSLLIGLLGRLLLRASSI